MPDGPPRLTFACELDSARLGALFHDPQVLEDLHALEARVVLMLSDYSEERAAVVRRLNDAGIPVAAVPLVPTEQGYYFTLDNTADAEASYERFTRWTAEQGLRWDGVGLDIEPSARIYQQIADNAWGLLPLLLPLLRDRERPARARNAYEALVARIHDDGWLVEHYQMPPIADERAVGSTLLQQVVGILDLSTDREVWMQYSSFMRWLGPRLLWSYGPQSPSIAVGTTGGGPVVPGQPQMPVLSWAELARDLRLARRWTDDVYVHSLEGCVQQSFLTRLRYLDWSEQVESPDRVWVADLMRRALRATLWVSAHPRLALGVGAASAWVLSARRQARRAQAGGPMLYRISAPDRSSSA